MRANREWPRVFGAALLAGMLAFSISGCGLLAREALDSGTEASSQTDVDQEAEAELQEIIDVLAQDFVDAGGSSAGCTCLVEWMLYYGDPDELVFGEEPPSDGEYLYFGRKIWLPSKYQVGFAECFDE